MPSNKITIACAGSGKTTFIVEEAIKIKTGKILITTYTNENIDQIKKFFIEKIGYIPSNITIQSWFCFLLQEGVRPYQNQITAKNRVQSIFFQVSTPRFRKKDDYFTPSNYIYSNKVSEFIYECNKQTNGLIIARLEKIYSHLFIDELQDFAGYDLNVLEMLFNSNIKIVAVCDPRQSTFSTNNSQKNKQHKKSNIYSWLKEKEKKKEIGIEEICNCRRCNQQICDFADKLFPELPKTTSQNTQITNHDGIFRIEKKEIKAYVDKFTPVILRYNINTDTLGYNAINIGMSKGRTYDRVLIFPTKPMLEYLTTDDLSKVGDKSKLYVATTRAKYSTTFVI